MKRHHRTLLLLCASLIALFGLVAFVLPAQAAPARPGDVTLPQPDGSSVTVQRWGDEWSHGVETPDGYTVIKDSASGYWVYAGRQADGTLAPVLVNGQALIAGKDAPASQALHARPAVQSGLKAQSAQPQAAVGEQMQNIGSQKLLLLLVDFPNQDHFYNADTFKNLLFGSSNSVRDFYLKASTSQLTINGAAETYPSGGETGSGNDTVQNDGVIGWLHLTQNHPNNTDNAYLVVAEALSLADKYVNFAAFDTNSDGYVTSTELHVIVVAAGYEESYCYNQCGSINVMWAHRSQVTNVTLDGKHLVEDNPTTGAFGGYAIFGERHGTAAQFHAATMGVMAHELGHDLSWPDLYFVDNGSGKTPYSGVGRWSIMGGGSWNGVSVDGDSPALPDAWLKYYQGWLTPTAAVNGNSYNLTPVTSGGGALRMGSNPNGVDWNFYRASGTGEYWLAEYRTKTGYDSGLPGCGVLLWHINESVAYDNQANANRSNPLVALEQADGYNDLYYKYNQGDTGDPYPGTSANLSFGPSTNPNSRTNAGSATTHQLDFQNVGCGSTSIQLTYTQTTPPTQDKYLYLPMVMYQEQFAGKVTDNGAAVQGVTIYLDYTIDGGTTYSNFDSTTTAADGSYAFTNLPPVTSSQQKFVVYYFNESATYNNRLGYYECNMVTVTNKDLSCNMEIHDIVMTGPQPGYYGVPITFTWNKRAAKTDNYLWTLWQDNSSGGHTLIAMSDKLGYTGQFTLYSISVSTYTPYFWQPIAITPDGMGQAFYIRGVAFTTTSGPALDSQGQPALTPLDTKSGPTYTGIPLQQRLQGVPVK